MNTQLNTGIIARGDRYPFGIRRGNKSNQYSGEIATSLPRDESVLLECRGYLRCLIIPFQERHVDDSVMNSVRFHSPKRDFLSPHLAGEPSLEDKQTLIK